MREIVISQTIQIIVIFYYTIWKLPVQRQRCKIKVQRGFRVLTYLIGSQLDVK